MQVMSETAQIDKQYMYHIHHNYTEIQLEKCDLQTSKIILRGKREGKKLCSILNYYQCKNTIQSYVK